MHSIPSSLIFLLQVIIIVCRRLLFYKPIIHEFTFVSNVIDFSYPFSSSRIVLSYLEYSYQVESFPEQRLESSHISDPRLSFVQIARCPKFHQRNHLRNPVVVPEENHETYSKFPRLMSFGS